MHLLYILTIWSDILATLTPPQASLISRLTSENLVLQQQMDQNVTGPQSNGHNQHQQHRSGSPSGVCSY
jgi:hypothetical protein